MPTGTTNYGWSKPDVGGSNGAWGTLLNAIFDAVDSAVFAISNVANAALPKSGGAMTGRLDLITLSQAAQALGNVSGATSHDLTAHQAFSATVTGAWQPAFTGLPPGSSGFLLVLTNGGAFAITWPGNVKWAGGSAPALTAAGTDVLAFVTVDGGTTFRGILSSKDSR